MIDYAILSCLLYNNEMHTAVEVEDAHFSTPHTSIIFKAIMEALRNKGGVDINLLAAYLGNAHPEHDWMPHLETIAQTIGAKASFSHYQDQLKKQYTDRVVKRIGQRLIDDCDVTKALDQLRNISVSPSRNGYDPQRIAKSFLQHLDNPPKSIPSGIARIDEKLGGLHASDLIVLGARPAMGKTALAVNLALGCKHPFLFFSGEQGHDQLMERMVAIEGGVPLWRMRNRSLSAEDYRNVADSVSRLSKSDFYVVDTPAPTLQDIVSEARKQAYKRGIKLVVIDYLQRMKSLGDSRREAVEASVRGLKELARELDIPVVVLAQVNRAVDNRENKHPTMGDLMESGAIEAEADQIIMLSREVVYDQHTANKSGALVTIAKNRHGPTGKVELQFQSETLRFMEVA